MKKTNKKFTRIFVAFMAALTITGTAVPAYVSAAETAAAVSEQQVVKGTFSFDGSSWKYIKNNLQPL